MGLPITKVLYAHLAFLEAALVIARSLALKKGEHEQISDLMDTVHNIPGSLSEWEFCDENILREYLKKYDQKWCKVKSDPRLLTIYDRFRKFDPLDDNEIILDSGVSEVQDRIEFLLSVYLRKIAPTKNNRIALFRDKKDGGLWELYDLNGGDLHVRPFGLRRINKEEALAKYDIQGIHREWLLKTARK